MLKYLHIENIAVIEHSEIEFKEGFNILTGETGAGKSIIIDSINAVLGHRTSKDLIRAGCENAEVSALFGNFTKENIEFLKQFDIEPDEDGNLIIIRRLSLNGKGIIKINGKPATAACLRDIAPCLIDIHGQHDNQALLDPQMHCGYIDALAENSAQISDYYDEFRKINRLRKELGELEINEDEKLRRTELLKYQISELTAADIKVGELQELKSRLQTAENFEITMKSLMSALSLLYGDDENDGAITLLKNTLKQFQNLKSAGLEKTYSKLVDIISIAEDIGAETTNFADKTSALDMDINSINERLDTLNRLMLKYGSSEEEMLSFLNNATKELDNIEGADKMIAKLENELEQSKIELIALGKKLSATRQTAARIFEVKVCEILKYLNMPNVRFAVNIEQNRYTKSGCDELEFLISANAGEELKPLHKIASGGELSRVMLSIKSAMLGKDSVGTMIFDEIDTGISGFAADKVGTQLKKVSAGRQVICVTHLAQIAARADNHLLISKTTQNGRTYTAVTPLDYEGRISEIARIMSGTRITENLYNSAKELLDRS